MSINKKLLFLLYLIGICVSCTKEDVTPREEGYVTIVPLWEEEDYYMGIRFSPIGKTKYYLYNIDNISASPIIITDSEGKGFTKKLPVGVYRLIGYNTNASNNITFDDSKPSTVVAKIFSDDFNPLNLYTVSCDSIIIEDNRTIIKEIIPVEIKAKTIRLNFNFSKLSPHSLRGKIEGISTSINLLNGEAFEDKNFISFENFLPSESNPVIFKTSGLLDNSGLSASTKPSVLSLTLEDSYSNSNYTGDVSLENIIKELKSPLKNTNDITLNVIVSKYLQEDWQNQNRIQITTYLK
jgi:hypothetical protein